MKGSVALTVDHVRDDTADAGLEGVDQRPEHAHLQRQQAAMSLRLQGAGMARCRVDPSDGSTHHFQLKVIENHLHEHERFAWTAAAAAAAAALSPGCAGAGSTRPEGRRHDAHTWGHHDKTPLIRLLTMLPIGALTRLGGHDAAEHGARHLPTAVCRHARVGRLAQWHDARAQQRSVGGAAAPQQDSSRTAAAAAAAAGQQRQQQRHCRTRQRWQHWPRLRWQQARVRVGLRTGQSSKNGFRPIWSDSPPNDGLTRKAGREEDTARGGAHCVSAAASGGRERGGRALLGWAPIRPEKES